MPVVGAGKDPGTIEPLYLVLRIQECVHRGGNIRRRRDHFGNGLIEVQPLRNTIAAVYRSWFVFPAQTQVKGKTAVDLVIVHDVAGIAQRDCFLNGNSRGDGSIVDVAKHEGGPLAARSIQVRTGIRVGRECLFDVEGKWFEPRSLAFVDAIFAAKLQRVATLIVVHSRGTAVALGMLPEFASGATQATAADVKSWIVI